MRIKRLVCMQLSQTIFKNSMAYGTHQPFAKGVMWNKTVLTIEANLQIESEENKFQKWKSIPLYESYQ